MIVLDKVSKSYGDKVVYKDFTLTIKENSITVILGESGSGKTTLLNILANLTDYGGQISGEITPVSMVFQTDRLIKTLTVKENLQLVNSEINAEYELEKVGLKEYADKYIGTLSGGMKRRVAILRAFVYPSKLLLMDEPFNSLDIALKYSIIENFLDMQKKDGRTAVVVTHDIAEAVKIADRIIVIKGGKIYYDNSEISENTQKEIFDLMLKIGNKE